MDDDPTYQMVDAAYATIALHAAKYPATLTGLLVGTVSSTASATPVVSITHALPLTHSDLATLTTPLLETALHLASHHAAAQSASLVGLYYAASNPQDSSIPVPPTRLADRLRLISPHACLLVVDAASLTPTSRRAAHCLRVHAKRAPAGTWGRGARPRHVLHVSADALALVDRLLAAPRVLPVADFEDHCLDPRADWLNVALPGRLSALASN